MDDLKVLHAKVKKWDDKNDPLAKLDDYQLSIIGQIEDINAELLKINKVIIASFDYCILPLLFNKIINLLI